MKIRSEIMTTSLVAVVLVLFACTQGMGGVIFSVDHNNLPAIGASAAPWDGFSLRNGDPTVVDFGGEKWMENKRDTSDRLRHDSGGHGTTPIPINGATIVTAIKPTRHASGNPWTSIVDIFYDQLCMGVMNETGQVKVKVSGANAANPIWTSSNTLPEEPGVLSLSVGSGANPAFEVFWRGENDAAAISMGTGNGNTGGAPYTALYPSANGRGYAQYINLGGNDPDGWPIFNGLIGDTVVYDEQLSPADLLVVQDQVRAAMSIGGGDPEPEPYRLVFVTSEPVPSGAGTDPGDTNMAALNTWVTSMAQAPGAVDDGGALGTTWSVVGATSAVNVFDNTDTEPGVDTDTPIYMVDGTLFAASLAEFWTPGRATLNINELGNLQTSGSTAVHTGLEAGPVTSDNPLDDAGNLISHGGRDSGYTNWYGFGETWAGDINNTSLFAISGVIGGDAAAIPEPSTFALAALGLLGLGVVARRRRRRK